MKLKLDDIILIPYRHEFAKNLAVVAKNIKIAKNMRDAFPHPYSLQNAHDFIQICMDKEIQSVFAVFYNGSFAGSGGSIYKKMSIENPQN